MPSAIDENPVARASGARERRTAFLRFLAFLGAAVGLTAVGVLLAKVVFKLHLDLDTTSLSVVLLGEVALVLLSVVLPTGLMIAFTREPAVYFGWGVGRRVRHLLLGLVGGVCLMGLLLGLIAACGGAVFAASPLPAASIARYGFGYAAIFALTALSEEGLMRGYGLFQLSRAISFWPAALVTSLLFAAAHLVHKDENPIGLAQVGLFGLLMAFSVLRSGGLWFALGFHAAWDFAETFIFGVPDSGVASAGSLLTAQFHGPAWLTGGSAGPEGSVLVLPTLALSALIIQWALRRDPSPTRLPDARI